MDRLKSSNYNEPALCSIEQTLMCNVIIDIIAIFLMFSKYIPLLDSSAFITNECFRNEAM